jgi:hypothetical protein
VKKLIAGAVIAGAAVMALPAVAGAEGNAWGKDARACVAAFDVNLGQGIQAGKAAHPGAKVVPQSIAQSVHCTD